MRILHIILIMPQDNPENEKFSTSSEKFVFLCTLHYPHATEN